LDKTQNINNNNGQIDLLVIPPTEGRIREYAEEMDVTIIRLDKNSENYASGIYKSGYREERLVIKALNEGGYNSTEVDLVDLLKFVKNELPDLWRSV